MQARTTIRKLKKGEYEAWRKAWEPKERPKGVMKSYVLRNFDELVEEVIPPSRPS